MATKSKKNKGFGDRSAQATPSDQPIPVPGPNNNIAGQGPVIPGSATWGSYNGPYTITDPSYLNQLDQAGFVPNPAVQPGTMPTPGTPGAPGYTPGMQDAQFPLPGGTMPGTPGTAPGGSPLNLYDAYLAAMGQAPQAVAPGATPGGVWTDPTMQGISGDYQDAVISDPTAYYYYWAQQMGIPTGGGTYAMGAQNAPAMGYEWMMTPGAQNPQATGNDLALYFAENAQQGMTPGAGYYTPQQFIEQAFTQGSAMSNYIWGDPTDPAVTPDQQFANFVDAMEMVLGGSMNDQMLGFLADRYAAAYRAYNDAVVKGDPAVAGMTLQDWMLQYGLGPQQAGG